MDKSGPKNNNFGNLIWKGGSGVLTTILVGFRYFPKLSRYLYDHKAIKLTARYRKFKIKQFLCLSIFIYIFQGCVAILFSRPVFLIFPS